MEAHFHLLKKALEDGVEDLATYERISEALTDLGRFDEAEKYCRRGLDRFPEHWGLYDTMGLIKRRTGNPTAAIPYYDKAIRYYKGKEEDGRTSALIYSNKGTALFDLKKYDDALKCFDIAINIQPSYRRSWLNKYLMLVSLSRNDEAVEFMYELVRGGEDIAKLKKEIEKHLECVEYMNWGHKQS